MNIKQILNKFNFRNISLLFRIYIAFAIVIAVFACSSIITCFTQTSIKTAFGSVEKQAQPVAMTASKLEVAMLSTNQNLFSIITAQTPADIDKYIGNLETARKQLDSALEEFDHTVNSSDALEDYDLAKQALGSVDSVSMKQQVVKLSELVHAYLDKTAALPTDRKNYLTNKVKVDNEQGQFISLMSLMSIEIEKIKIKLDDFFINKLVLDLGDVRLAVEKNMHSGFKNENSAQILEAFKHNSTLIQQFKDKVKELNFEVPSFESDLEGAYFKPLYKGSLDKSGVLYKTYELVAFKEGIDAKAAEGEKYIEEAQVTLKSIQNRADDFSRYSANNVNNYIVKSIEFAFGSLLLVICIVVIVSLGLAKSIKKPMHQLIDVMDKAADGDLTANYIDSFNDEFSRIGQGLNKMNAQTKIVISKLVSIVSELRDTANQNSSVVNASNEALDVQRKEAFMVASSTAELEQTLSQVAESAQHTLDEITNVSKVSEQGRQVMSDNITTTHSLDAKLKETSDAITKVNQMGENIGSVISVIRGIAEQTNLLALNAAIEAARAGEQGRGFAVVADEVRTLANRTSESTKEITVVISDLRNTIAKAVNVINTCNEEMETSVEQASKANSSIEEIMGYITSIDQMTSQIVESAHEQEIATREINQNITKISELADQNSEDMNNIQRSSETLDRIATEQTDIVKKFKL